jgi:hypothetical protein
MSRIGIGITLGDGKEFFVDQNNELLLLEVGPRIDRAIKLGRFTHKRLDNLKDYLERLRPHAMEE